MPTVLKLSPRDHGRRLTREEFEAAQGVEGYCYELIDGTVYVSPAPQLAHDCIVQWISDLLHNYRWDHAEVISYISGHAEVPVPDCPKATVPEPDLAAYRDSPLRLPVQQRRWENISPILVAEVISEDDPDKDLVRNVELYEQVLSIREYWIFDPRTDADAPSLRVYRRRGRAWQRPMDVAPGETYTTRLLPGFTLRLTPPD